MRIIVPVAAEETGLGSKAYSPLQHLYYAHILQMEFTPLDLQASSPSQAASQLECFLTLQSLFYLLNSTSF